MAYTVYNTDALVCGHKDHNTSDRLYRLFTKEAGMLWATAKSVRMEKSKHRYALQDFSVIRVSLVRGKGGWRIVSSVIKENLYYNTSTRTARATLRNAVRLLIRVVHGEEPQEALFDEVVRGLAVLESVEDAYLDIVLSLRILNELGYVSAHPAYVHLLERQYQYDAIDTLTTAQVTASKEAVKHALLSSQL